MDEQHEPDDGMKPTMVGHIVIRDVDTGEVLLRQRDNLVQQSTIQKDEK
jgi:hypothetical protein